METFQLIFLTQAVVFSALTVVFLLISRWAVVSLREYAGYGLGWLIALFFFMVYVLSGGGFDDTPTSQVSLQIFHIFLATVIGIFAGLGVQVGFKFGMGNARTVALQVAIYTAMNLILLV
ncbi:MAG: hypothetical protein AAFR67_08940, partial [Chloroflexota bacterium]